MKVLLLLVGIATLVPQAGTAAALRLEVTNLTELYSLPNDPLMFAQVSGLNENGSILHRTFDFPPEAGGVGVSTELFLEHQDGSSTRFEIPYANGLFSEVRLNNRGEVATTIFPDRSNIDLATREIWVYSASGVATRIEGFIGGMGMENLSFNDAGQIAVSNTDEDRAFRYTPGTGWEDLGSLADDGFAVPRAINNSGAVTGATSVGASSTITPFLFLDGSGMEDIPAPFGQGRAVNDNFAVTGDGGWVWFPDEVRLEFIFMDQAFGFLRPKDINDHASLIGATVGSFPGTGFFWDETEGYQILSNIVTDPMWRITDAFAINNDNWILANGYYGFGPPQPDTEFSWLLLRPIPEPSSLALLVGAATLLLRRRR